MKTSQKVIIAVVIIIVLGGIGGGAYFMSKKENISETSSSVSSTSTAQTQSAVSNVSSGSAYVDSLTTARKKGRDAATKANLSSLRASAEIYYDKTGSYAGFCSKDSASASIKENLAQVGIVCNDSRLAYAVSAYLQMGGFYCVDNTGHAREVGESATGTSCGRAQ